MRTLAKVLESPGKGASDKALLDHLLDLRRAVHELSEAIKVVEEELGERRATRFREGIKRG
jgi:hypothetical protein